MTDKEKIVETIKDTPILITGALRANYEEAIASALIANGIGDISAEKARADRAERALEKAVYQELNDTCACTKEMIKNQCDFYKVCAETDMAKQADKEGE